MIGTSTSTTPLGSGRPSAARAAASGSASPDASETRFGPATLRHVEGLRVLTLRGSFHEMGRQHGTLLADDVRRGPIPYYRHFIEKILRNGMPAALAPLAWKALQRGVGGRVARALPDFARETVQGLAEGAGIPYEEMLEGCTMPDAMVWLASRLIQLRRVGPAVHHRLALGIGCTSAVAWGDATRDGKLYHARNFDYHGVSSWPSTAAVVFHEPERGQRYVSVSAAGVALGGITAMNESGLSLTVHQHMFTDRVRLGGTPIGTVGDQVMREARSLEDAERILAEQRPIGCWTYVVTCGRTKRVLCWEENPERHAALRRGPGGGTFAYANIYLDRELGDTERNLYGTYWRHNHGRYVRAQALLDEGRGRHDQASLGGILADTGDPRCRLRDSIAMVLTVGSVVFRPEDGVLWVATGEAPTSHGTFVPFDFAHAGHAPEHGSFEVGGADTDARRAFEHWRRAYVAYVDQADAATTRDELEQAASIEPRQPVYHAALGLVALGAGDAQAAARAMDRAIEIGHPDEERLASFHLWRGRARDVAGDRQGASRDYRHALALRSDPPVHEAARRDLARPFSARRARGVQIDMSLGDVVTP